MVEVGDISQEDYRKEINRYKREAHKESQEQIGKAADEYVAELGDAREGVLAELRKEQETGIPSEAMNA